MIGGLVNRLRALVESIYTFETADVEKLRKDFLMLMKNVPKIDNYRDLLDLHKAVKTWNDRFETLIFKQLVPNIRQAVTEKLGEHYGDLEARIKDWDKRIRSECWDLHINLRLPFEEANTDYWRKYNASWEPGQAKEVGEQQSLADFVKKRDKWLAKVKREATPAWKTLKEYITWLEVGSAKVKATVEIPSDEFTEIEGYKIRLVGADKIGSDSDKDIFMDVLPRLRAGLKVYKQRAKRVLPWIVANQLRMEITFNNCSPLEWAARYHAQGYIEVCVWALSGNDSTPENIAHTLAHEMCHHVYKVYLGDEHRKFWRTAIGKDRGQLDLVKLANIWEEHAPRGFISDLDKYLRDADPIMFLQVETLTHGHGNQGKSAFFSLDELKDLIAKGTTTLSVPTNPITAYADKNDEEAFCEALGMLIGYGPRALLPEVRGWLKTILPEIKVESVSDLAAEIRGLVESRSVEKKFKEFTLSAYAREHENEWSVEAYTGNWLKVGEATFAGVYKYRDDPWDDETPMKQLVALKGWNVAVKEEYRRKGLASAMYQFAEEAFKLKVQPGDFQTPDGGSFLKGKKS